MPRFFGTAWFVMAIGWASLLAACAPIDVLSAQERCAEPVPEWAPSPPLSEGHQDEGVMQWLGDYVWEEDDGRTVRRHELRLNNHSGENTGVAYGCLHVRDNGVLLATYSVFAQGRLRELHAPGLFAAYAEDVAGAPSMGLERGDPLVRLYVEDEKIITGLLELPTAAPHQPREGSYFQRIAH